MSAYGVCFIGGVLGQDTSWKYEISWGWSSGRLDGRGRENI